MSRADDAAESMNNFDNVTHFANPPSETPDLVPRVAGPTPGGAPPQGSFEPAPTDTPDVVPNKGPAHTPFGPPDENSLESSNISIKMNNQ